MKNDKNRKTLLIVDDVELFIQLQISHLGHQRYNIHTAHTGAAGLEKARDLNPDLILMDLFMPDMNGDQVCRTLKDDPATSSIPVVLVSSGAKDVSRSISRTSRCDGLIYKPVRRDLLLSVVENLLGTNMRGSERVNVSFTGTATLDEKEHPVTIRTLSSDGAFVETSQRTIRGDLMELSFALPDSDRNIHVRAAAVVWCGTLGPGGPDGAGVYFLTMDAQMRSQISEFVQKQVSLDPASCSEEKAEIRNSG